MRKPVVAGQFYPANKTVLEKEIKKYLKKKPEKGIICGIVPHAGYFFSGKAAGKVYSVLPDTGTFVIIGTNHSGIGRNIAISLEDFETPLGVAKNDIQLGKQILQELKIEEDNSAHKYEHSIEVQLPFLQFSQKNFKIVPILIGRFNIKTCQELAKSIHTAAKKLKKRIIVLASSDFTHSGPAYMAEIDKNIDKEAIDKILELDSNGFLVIAEKTTICGAGAIATAIEFAKLQGCREAKLLDYYTSSDIMPNESWVGYAGIVFLKM